MAFKLEVLRGTTTYDISNGNPFSFDKAEGMGGASVRTIEERGPFQDGATHLDYRLEPRTITLSLLVQGTAASTLDGHRDTLTQIFKPVRGVPITLKLTRDDGKVRQIDTQRTGPSDIPLVPINRPGNLHRSVVQLRAADPVWYDPDEEEINFLGPSGDWWLGFATIGTANVLTHVENPAIGENVTLSGSVAADSAWSWVARTNTSGQGTGNAFLFSIPTGIFDSSGGSIFARANIPPSVFGNHDLYTLTAGTAGMSFSNSTDPFGFTTRVINSDSYGTAVFASTIADRGRLFVNGTQITNSPALPSLPLMNTNARYWRRDPSGGTAGDYAPEITHAAIYNVELNATQVAAVSEAIETSGGTAYSVVIPYAGDIDSYPVVNLVGPLADPVLTNITTGDKLDFTGGTVGSSDIWTIDTRYGHKSAKNLAGSSVLRYLSGDSDLSTFRLVPNPIATGGTNVVKLDGSALDTGAGASITYHTRYLGF